MRPTRLGLAAVAAALVSAISFIAPAAYAKTDAATTDIPKEARATGMKDAPKVVQAAGIPCQIADARFVGLASDAKTKAQSKYYEVACTGGMGFVVVDKGADAPAGWASCLDQAKLNPDGKPNPAACMLPGNTDQKAQIAPFVAKTGSGCALTDVRGIGHGDTASYFEIACDGGRGYVMKTSSPPKPDQPVSLITCLAYDASSPVACKLTTSASQLAVIDALAGQSGKSCQVKDRRYMLTTEDSNNYYEVACQDGKGYVLQEGPTGKLVSTIDCAIADRIGDGCRLTNSRQAETAQLDLYTKLARNAGYACDVTKYGPFETAPRGYDIVELACSNRPDGAVAIFPASGSEHPKIYDCVHSELAGYRCGFSKQDAAFPKITDDLKKLGKVTCAVSNARVVGVTKEKVGYLEVACADGAPGFLISYTVDDMNPKEAIACGIAGEVAGGCKLPGNTKHG
jgi:hypothetical protein